MAGHSQFKNIMHRKKAVDAKRSRVFSKHARLILLAARGGGADPATNATLRDAIDRARADDMSKDAIERAVAKAVGGGEGAALEAVTYEAYGPGGVAILIDALTDNRHRTAADVRSAVEHNGGSLAGAGAVSWNFERKAVFFVPAPAEREEQVLLAALEAGADDCARAEGGFEVTADPGLSSVAAEALTAAGFPPGKREVAHLPKSTVRLTDTAQVQTLVAILTALDDLDDVQATATSLEWTEQALSAAERA